MTVALGLMSGTSMDGVDAVVCEITPRKNSHPAISFIAHAKVSYPADIKRRLMEVSGPHGSAQEICALDPAVGDVFAKVALKAIGLAEKRGFKVDAIGSHGQTVRHLPKERSTLQIGSPSIIAKKTGVAVWSGFRNADMARGGQGAPLAPIVHLPLFGDREKDVAVVNIGGIANITFIPGGASSFKQVLAYDTGPGNMLIDYAVEKAGLGAYDRSGRVAARGKINEKLLSRLASHPYFKRIPPKSTGREDFGGDVFFRRAGTGVKWNANLVATVTELTAVTIASEIKRTASGSRKPLSVVVCGGGAKNLFLLTRLWNHLQDAADDVEVGSSSAFGFPAEYVEGALMALLAHYAMTKTRLDLSSVTGAVGEPGILGSLTPA
ncbi:MAG: anhydro-N-acetylmuramic acid kinase [Nitrospinae bacterium]|nr:anhydro-N-acetylmuramic acid kinase [Nitrospinota bacterium]